MEELLNVLDGYCETLVISFYLPIATVKAVVLLDYIIELEQDPNLPLIASCEQLEIICSLKECLKQNCLI